MANKTNFTVNGHVYFRYSRTVGHDPETGRGIITVRAKAEIEEHNGKYQIVDESMYDFIQALRTEIRKK